MYILNIIICIINLLIFLSFIIFYKKIRRKLKNKIEENLEKDYIKKENELSEKIKRKEEEVNNSLELTTKILEQEEEKRNLIISQESEIINKELENYRIKKNNEIETEFIFLNQNLQKEYDAAKENFQKYLEETKLALEKYNEQINKDKENKANELTILAKELEDYQKRRDVVNENIRREKEIREKENFYKINISNNDIEDIQLLKTVEPNLKNKEALNKLIYEVFIKKPTTEMIKRILDGGSPSGIYKITFIPTGEAYIGKSSNINKRWIEHIKSAYGLGTIAHSSFHTRMAKEGVWNFTFELLEKIEKERLGEREKYWIEFYQTKEFGLNERSGG